MENHLLSNSVAEPATRLSFMTNSELAYAIGKSVSRLQYLRRLYYEHNRYPESEVRRKVCSPDNIIASLASNPSAISSYLRINLSKFSTFIEQNISKYKTQKNIIPPKLKIAVAVYRHLQNHLRVFENINWLSIRMSESERAFVGIGYFSRTKHIVSTKASDEESN